MPKWSNAAKITDVVGKSSHYDALFYPGGAGPMFDLAIDPVFQALISEFAQAGKPVAFVCHAPIALQNVSLPNGNYLMAWQTRYGT